MKNMYRITPAGTTGPARRKFSINAVGTNGEYIHQVAFWFTGRTQTCSRSFPAGNIPRRKMDTAERADCQTRAVSLRHVDSPHCDGEIIIANDRHPA